MINGGTCRRPGKLYEQFNRFCLQINFNELMNFIQGTGISLQQRFLGYQRRDINGIFEFFDTLQNALLTNVKRAFVNVSFFSISIHLSILTYSCTHLNTFVAQIPYEYRWKRNNGMYVMLKIIRIGRPYTNQRYEIFWINKIAIWWYCYDNKYPECMQWHRLVNNLSVIII